MEYFSFKKKLSVSFIAMLLTASSVQAARKPPPWVQFTGKGYQFCDALLKELKRFDYSQVAHPGNEYTCARELVIPHFKQLKEPPWQKLNPEQYRPLLRRIFTEGFYPQIERDFYQPDALRTRASLTREQEEQIERKIDNFIANGRYLRIWRMPFPVWLEESARNQNMPVTPLIFIQTAQLRDKDDADFITSRCKGIPLSPSKIASGSLYLVNESLDGPDPRVMVYGRNQSTDLSRMLKTMVWFNNKIYLYRGIPHFSAILGPAFISSGKREWLNENYCQIN
ncbi:hypothetical protein EB837_26030 [Kluyvera ascorbata]|uniref:Uncharacterized protein n=1 Tax=Kluyvera ascorbata TaxID=51288 RepID=A0A3N2RN22_9ENTR|nr:hypothetical protein [Kluyvera ascorbata]ROU08781.1 hypothetical protein EB837_26030 [Kluyvera ascorbata]